METGQKNIHTGARTILGRQTVMVVLFCLLGYWLRPAFIWPWGIGCCAGLLDNLLVLRGIVQGMKKQPAAAAQGMHFTMLLRMAALAAIAIIMLKLGYNALGVFFGYLAVYVTMLINMVFFSYRMQTKPSLRKGAD